MAKINNKLTQLFLQKKTKILNIYFTAGYPQKESTAEILLALQNSGVDIVEIGMPYSDPIADGPIIQNSNHIAINNGMNIDLLFAQLKTAKSNIKIPIVLMGYLNPILQYGLAKFCKAAASVGVSGIILPDLPMYEYEHIYKTHFEENNVAFIFLITPQTSNERIVLADKASSGFIYAVSSNAITGSNVLANGQEAYFNKLKSLKLKNPILIGFGINNKQTFDNACKYAAGAIVGSAFIKAIAGSINIEKTTKSFVNLLR